jgi:hypothetical protein
MEAAVTPSQQGSTVRELHDRLIPAVAVALTVLLVASLSAAIVLPRHAEVPFAGVLDGTAVDEVAVAPAASAPPATAPEQTAPEPAEPAAGEQTAPAPSAVLVESDPGAEPELSAVETAAPQPPTEPAGPAEPAAPVPAAPPSPAEGPAYQESTAPAPAPPPPPSHPPSGEERTVQAAGAGQSESERIFAEEFPIQAAARQTDDPSTHSWAVLIGVNRYQGRTADTLGSVADVMVLREVLLARGWRDDHILVLTDIGATHDRIIRGIEWLIRSTDERSTVVFSFSGHMRHRDGVTALWPTDNRFIWAGDLGRMIGAIPAGRLWASLQGCHAEGLRVPGLEAPNHVVTYSSRRAEKSYEDPEVGHSVKGYYMFAEGFRDGHGDLDGDGRISVQEAHGWAAPRAHTRTSQRQTPLIHDGRGGAPFFLEIGSG